MGPQDLEVAESLHDLARLHLERGEFDLAGQRIERALEIRENLLGPADPLVADTLTHRATHLLRFEETDEAERVVQRVLRIRELAGVEDSAKAETLWLLAMVQYAQSQDAAVPKISVSGNALVRVTPDKVTVHLGIETWDLDIHAAKKKNNDILARTIDAIKKAGVKEKNVQTFGVTYQN